MKTNRRCPHRRKPRRSGAMRTVGVSGFTLLEVLVALALSVILLAAVSGAIRLYYRLSTAGREQMERAQLVRALFRQMESDIRSVAFALTQQPAADSGGAAATEETDPALIETVPPAAESEGILGDSTTLVLHVSRPSLPVLSSQATGTVGSPGDLGAVSYLLAVRGASGLSGAIARNVPDIPTIDGVETGTVMGLARLETDRLTLRDAEDAGSLESLADFAPILAPEVASLAFAYWDGLAWTDTWDSITNGRLPAAIEITLAIDLEAFDPFGNYADASDEAERPPPVPYRHVVVIPLAEPYVGELTY